MTGGIKSPSLKTLATPLQILCTHLNFSCHPTKKTRRIGQDDNRRPQKTYFYRRSGSVKYCANQGEGQKLKYTVRIMALLCFGKLLISLINTSFKLAGYLVDIKRST